MKRGVLCLWVIAVVAVSLASAQVLPREAWVVGAGSRKLIVIRTSDKQVVATISLGTLATPAPQGIGFSTVPGHVGRYAYVTQGSQLRVIDAVSRLPLPSLTIDLATVLGRPVTLRGIDAALVRDLDPSPVIRDASLLHIAADVEPPGGGSPRPWFIILHQERVLGLEAGPKLVQAASLGTVPAGVTAEAMKVTAINTEYGPSYQRAWYTYRILPVALTAVGSLDSNPGGVKAVEIGAPQTLAPSWQTIAERSYNTGTATPPVGVNVGAPFDRELPVLADPIGDTVSNLQTGGSCSIPGNLTSVELSGPAPSYRYFALDTGTPGGNGGLVQFNGRSCDVTNTTPLKKTPIDLEVLGTIKWSEVYVANKDSDVVSVVTRSPSGVVNIGLPEVFAAPCVECPVDVALQPTEATSCTVADLFVTKSGSDLSLSWTGAACDPLKSEFVIRCNCQNADGIDGNCPVGCATTVPLGGFPSSVEGVPAGGVTGTPWAETGRSNASDATLAGYAVSSTEGVNILVGLDDGSPEALP
ncbi:MAG: hypothetical protein U0V87_06920 [Acidobacteriota bacterium]